METVSGGRYSVTDVLKSTANDLGLEARFFALRTPQEVDAVFAEIVAWRADAISASGLQVGHARQRIADLLIRHRMASVSFGREMVEAGGLLSYAPAAADAAYGFNRFVDSIDRVLRGTPPAEMPVERPRRYELAINMKTAKALGLTIPQTLMLAADELIQ